MPSGVRLKCEECEVAWNDLDACWMCDGPGVSSYAQPSTGPNMAVCWPFAADIDEDDVLYWSGF